VSIVNRHIHGDETVAETHETTSSGDRRPIAARGHGWSRAAADFLIKGGASPNAISIAGMVAAILAGGCFALAPRTSGGGWIALWLLGALLVQARLVANMLDGMVAIGRGIASPVGELFNDVPDRVSDSAVLIGVGCAAGDLALGLAVALAAMATAYARALGRSIGAPSEFGGPMAKPHRMAAITGLAVLECVVPAGWTMPLMILVLWIILVLSLVTTARRLLRPAAHLRGAR
jgi:phosphatidylglycerophosphate synthase